MRRFIQIPWIFASLSVMIAGTFIITTIGFSGEEAAKVPVSPKVIAVKFHADW
ncbi:MAG: hypothetical protein O7E52_28945 [Candidatus Poribacteria bacterium]|nr:hypothetical protein [Candidatus Poribacteria bacterium]